MCGRGDRRLARRRFRDASARATMCAAGVHVCGRGAEAPDPPPAAGARAGGDDPRQCGAVNTYVHGWQARAHATTLMEWAAVVATGVALFNYGHTRVRAFWCQLAHPCNEGMWAGARTESRRGWQAQQGRRPNEFRATIREGKGMRAPHAKGVGPQSASAAGCVPHTQCQAFLPMKACSFSQGQHTTARATPPWAQRAGPGRAGIVARY